MININNSWRYNWLYSIY